LFLIKPSSYFIHHERLFEIGLKDSGIAETMLRRERNIKEEGRILYNVYKRMSFE
jgi:hypothetical protein